MITFDASELTPELWVGSYPQSPTDVLHLKAAGITAILNLQSDDDFRQKSIQWGLFWNFYVKQGMEVVRHPITDFDPQPLLEELPAAVERLNALVAKGHKVYVHCTAGINRSPSVCIGFLSKYRDMDVAAANELVKGIRPNVYPYPEVLKGWTRILGP
ncbi:MAG: protein-tyrosine phosphatase [Myxococcota bacterium]|jgi:protein-tyrosine phosphatase